MARSRPRPSGWLTRTMGCSPSSYIRTRGASLTFCSPGTRPIPRYNPRVICVRSSKISRWIAGSRWRWCSRASRRRRTMRSGFTRSRSSRTTRARS
uniref:Uncharacterized protein n=1 Tax=uncultured marine virus TaxID=186617 RepID=A0A0F7L506_9VIRU|nr:hypothetical protein [uncultured marine virus]